MDDPLPSLTFDGLPASGGIAIGLTYLLHNDEPLVQEQTVLDDEDVQIERERLASAFEGADRALAEVEALARRDVADRAAIFEALRMILADPVLRETIEERIVSERISARLAIHRTVAALSSRLVASTDPSMRQRAEDLHTIEAQLVAALHAAPVEHRFQHQAVLVLGTLLPGDALLHARNGAAAFVLETGGINSHAAILARSLGVPMVTGIAGALGHVAPHSTAIVDGHAGRIIINPSNEELGEYTRRQEALLERRRQLGALRELPAVTLDGRKVGLGANLDIAEEMAHAVESGADSIGLLRTEYLMMGRRTEMPVEEQTEVYQRVAERAFPLCATIRAFDIGSEKIAGEMFGARTTPLGVRGVRLLLRRPSMMEGQIEAVLRASTHRNLRLMAPMITTAEEMIEFRAAVERVADRLRAQGVPFDASMPVGAMIETPAAALVAEGIARACDFLALGTNDLAQYTLAVERTDEALAVLYDDMHPAVLRLIRATAIGAGRVGVPLSICGELAANLLATEALVGMGINAFSVPPYQLPAVKARIRSINVVEARRFAHTLLRVTSAAEARAACRIRSEEEVGSREL